MPRPMVLESPMASPANGDYWTTPEMINEVNRRPSFSRKQVAEFFFGRSAAWLRKAVLDNELVLDGEPYIFVEEIPKDAPGYYEFRLWDVERFAHALAESDVIGVAQLERVLLLVKTVAENYGYLE